MLCDTLSSHNFNVSADAEGKLILSALPAMAEKHLLHPSCFCQLHFSLTTHSALTLEGLSWP